MNDEEGFKGNQGSLYLVPFTYSMSKRRIKVKITAFKMIPHIVGHPERESAILQSPPNNI